MRAFTVLPSSLEKQFLIRGTHRQMSLQLDSLRRMDKDLPVIMLAVLIEDEILEGKTTFSASELFGSISMRVRGRRI